MIVIPGLARPLAAVGKRVTSCQDGEDGLTVQVCSPVRWAACPRCFRRSRQRHGRYHRRLDDQPSFGHPVTISLEIRRFKCGNAKCSQRTFSERIDALAAPGQRRTQRLNEALRSIGYSLGGSAAARLAARLGMNISGATMLRELRRGGCPAQTATKPIVIGIDDWAIKRGHRYGTIIVDLQRRRPIEVLGGRESTIVADWLEKHPTVEMVARDRAGAYSDAVQSAIPDAQQIADRWHLLTNLREAVERLLVRQATRLREAVSILGETLRIESQPLTADTGATVLPLSAWQRLGIDRRAARVGRYEEAVRRRRLGETFKAIGLAMNLDHRTVRRFIQAGSFPERARRTSGSTLLVDCNT